MEITRDQIMDKKNKLPILLPFLGAIGFYLAQMVITGCSHVFPLSNSSMFNNPVRTAQRQCIAIFHEQASVFEKFLYNAFDVISVLLIILAIYYAIKMRRDIAAEGGTGKIVYSFSKKEVFFGTVGCIVVGALIVFALYKYISN